MAFRGDLSSLRALKARVRQLPVSVAHAVAKDAAPALTDLTQDAFDASRSVYGEPRPEGVDGQPLTLRKTGALERDLRFVANGTLVRCRLGPRYAKYLIRYGILPNGPLPVGWSRRLGEIVGKVKLP